MQVIYLNDSSCCRHLYASLGDCQTVLSHGTDCDMGDSNHDMLLGHVKSVADVGVARCAAKFAAKTDRLCLGIAPVHVQPLMWPLEL